MRASAGRWRMPVGFCTCGLAHSLGRRNSACRRNVANQRKQFPSGKARRLGLHLATCQGFVNGLAAHRLDGAERRNVRRWASCGGTRNAADRLTRRPILAAARLLRMQIDTRVAWNFLFELSRCRLAAGTK